MTRAAHNEDIERTAASHFLDVGGSKRRRCRSYWTLAGHVYLFGIDASLRRLEIFERDLGCCQIQGENCLGPFVGWDGHLHHIKGGNTDDRCWCPHNLQWTCANCHREAHVRPKFGVRLNGENTINPALSR